MSAFGHIFAILLDLKVPANPGAKPTLANPFTFFSGLIYGLISYGSEKNLLTGYKTIQSFPFSALNLFSPTLYGPWHL